jgi:hypothetical protein
MAKPLPVPSQHTTILLDMLAFFRCKCLIASLRAEPIAGRAGSHRDSFEAGAQTLEACTETRAGRVRFPVVFKLPYEGRCSVGVSVPASDLVNRDSKTFHYDFQKGPLLAVVLLDRPLWVLCLGK